MMYLSCNIPFPEHCHDCDFYEKGIDYEMCRSKEIIDNPDKCEIYKLG